MLKFFNRLEKTRNFVLLIFSILMVGSLVFFYTPARNSFTGTNLSSSDETAAKVGSEKVTAGEIVRQKEQYSQMGIGRSFPANMVLQGLIGSRIAKIEADRLTADAGLGTRPLPRGRTGSAPTHSPGSSGTWTRSG